MAILTSYDLNGKKDSFANWISNLSPVDTFFVSTTKKEAVQNTMFQWQTDSLAAASAANAQVETSAAITGAFKKTEVHSNLTQILRKAVEVSDTADSLDNWGRGKELGYQMEKAGKEIKRDLELILLGLNNAGTGTNLANEGYKLSGKYSEQGDQGKEAEEAFKKQDDSTQDAVAGRARKTRSFGDLVAKVSTVAWNANETDATGEIKDKDTGAVVHKKSGVNGVLTEEQLFDITYNLYLAGSDANTIMFHPKHAAFFSSLMEVGAVRQKLIANMDTTLNKYVGSVIDPLGQQYSLVPNRYMPEDAIYYFNPKDWTQMVLREPQKVALAKKGSSERWMIEMELGLRHSNPFASGILELKTLN
ncbi:MAG: SU10 major capsid protein [Bacteroidales bacterium]